MGSYYNCTFTLSSGFSEFIEEGSAENEPEILRKILDEHLSRDSEGKNFEVMGNRTSQRGINVKIYSAPLSEKNNHNEEEVRKELQDRIEEAPVRLVQFAYYGA